MVYSFSKYPNYPIPNTLNKLELIGALFGIAGVWLTVKEKVWCFPVGIVNVIITSYLVFTAKLYADTLQQSVYFILLIIGWIHWSNSNPQSTFKISTLNDREKMWLGLILITGSAAMYFLLTNYTDASLPFMDSSGTMICFIAQYLIAKKKIENWLLWMVANSIYIVIFYVKGMEYYSILSAVYLVQAIIGWKNWNKKLTIDKEQ